MLPKQKPSMRYIIILIIIFISLLPLASSLLIKTAKKDIYEDNLVHLGEITKNNAQTIENKANEYLGILEVVSEFIGNLKTLDIEQIMPIINTEYGNYIFDKIVVISLDGQAITSEGLQYNSSQNEYFIKALNGKSSVSDPLTDTISGDKVNVFAVPIYHQGKVVGALFATLRSEQLADIINTSSYQDKALSFIIKSDGTTIAYTAHDNHKTDNLFDRIAEDSLNQKELDSFKRTISSGENAAASFVLDGLNYSFSSTKIGVNDWYMVTVVQDAFMSSVYHKLTGSINMVTLGLSAAAIGISCFIIRICIENNKKLAAMAYSDSITGYSNWSKFEEDCTQLLNSHVRTNKKYAMILLDINKFKVINDIFGYSVGNKVLRHIGDVLKKNTTEYECFGRNSADIFNILMEYDTDKDIVKRINTIISQVSGFLEGYIIELSFGIYKVTDALLSVHTLSDRASLAKMSIKNNNDTSFCFFNQVMRNELLREKQIENVMESALANREFEVYLQPKYMISTNKMIGAEALVRWNRPGRGLISPAQFIPIFEKNGFIKKLDLYMFEQVCAILGEIKKENNMEPISISVNISRIHFGNKTLLQTLLDIANKYCIDPSEIEIELTESAIYENSRMIETMNKLKDAGFILSIDDFGSGYSSLNTLKDLPANVLKLDKGFLETSTQTDRGIEIITSLIRMTKALGMSTVAEGVETLEQVQFLEKAGCDMAQGYFYAKPMPVDTFLKLIKTPMTVDLL